MQNGGGTMLETNGLPDTNGNGHSPDESQGEINYAERRGSLMVIQSAEKVSKLGQELQQLAETTASVRQADALGEGTVIPFRNPEHEYHGDFHLKVDEKRLYLTRGGTDIREDVVEADWYGPNIDRFKLPVFCIYRLKSSDKKNTKLMNCRIFCCKVDDHPRWLRDDGGVLKCTGVFNEEEEDQEKFIIHRLAGGQYFRIQSMLTKKFLRVEDCGRVFTTDTKPATLFNLVDGPQTGPKIID